jgi:DNA-binding transcriptional regulator YdaS (Cro superfamily)
MLETIKQACDIVGGPEELAKLLGCTRQNLHQLKNISRGRAIEIEEATGGKISRRDLRPDLFGEAA